MPIQLRHQTQGSNLPSAASHGVGLPVSDGGLGAASRALGQVAQATGTLGSRLARKEKALMDTEIMESVDQWRLKRSDLLNQIGAAQDSNDYKTVNELYEQYETLNPQNEGWDLSTYQVDPDKRKLKPEDWKEAHNNLQKEYLDEQLGVRRKKTDMEFNQKAQSVNTGMDDIVKGFHQSEKPYSPSNMDQLFAYVDTPVVSTLLAGLPEESSEKLRESLIFQHTDSYFKSAVDHFRSANDPVGAQDFLENGKKKLKEESSLSGEARGQLEQHLNDLIAASKDNFDSSASVRRLTNSIFYGKEPAMAVVEIKQLTEQYPENKQLRELDQNGPVFFEYARPSHKRAMFDRISPAAPYADFEDAVNELDVGNNLTEIGRERLITTMRQDTRTFRTAMSGDNFDQALAVLDPFLHSRYSKNPYDKALREEAIDTLDPDGSMNLSETWHPAWEVAEDMMTKGDPNISTSDVLSFLNESFGGPDKAAAFTFNNIYSTKDKSRKTAAALFLDSVYGPDVSKSFKEMLDDTTQGGVRARERAASFLDDLREDPEFFGTVPDALDDQIGYMGTALGNYAALLAYGIYRDNPKLQKEDVLHAVNDKIEEKLDIVPTGWSGKGSVLYVPKDFVDTEELSNPNYMQRGGPIMGRLFSGTLVHDSELGRRVGLELSRSILAQDADIGIAETWRGMSKDTLDVIKAEGGMAAYEIEWMENNFSEEQQIVDMLEAGVLYPEFKVEGGKLVGRIRFKQDEAGVPSSLRYVRNLRGIKDPSEYRNAPPITIDYNEMMKKAMDISYEPREILRKNDDPYQSWGLNPQEKAAGTIDGSMMRINRFFNPWL